MLDYFGYMSATSILLYIVPSILYLVALTVAYFITPEKKYCETQKVNRFAIIIPAYNEELLIERLIKSLLSTDYLEQSREVFVIADNCSDRTSEICAKYPVKVLERENTTKVGKGYALNWAFGKIQIDKFNAVLIIDADNTVNTEILKELNTLLNSGELAIQCCNNVGNRYDSWITELLYVSRTVSNKLYHHSKYKLGLSSYLMGNGMCFKSKLLKFIGWEAYSQGEDWEYTAGLIKQKIKIAFALRAKVFHQESRSLKQAKSQRLRWASGKFRILRKLGIPIFIYAVKNREYAMLDSVLPIIFPNFSQSVNLSICSIGICMLLPRSEITDLLITLSLGSLSGLIGVFFIGAIMAGDSIKTLKASIMAPMFLIWKFAIDIMTVSGVYKDKRWVRTTRHQPEAGEKEEE